MVLKVYLGSAADITARLAGAPSATTTTVSTVTDDYTFTVASVTSFSVDDSIVVRKQRRVISAISGTTITVSVPFSTTPQIGDTMKHYDADHSGYRDDAQAFSFINDLETGGRTGDYVSQDLAFVDWDYSMTIPGPGLRISIFDDEDPDLPVFAGVAATVKERLYAKDRSGNLLRAYTIEGRSYQYEADSYGIEESPRINVNAGKFLKILMERYTSLEEGEIDITNSPTVDYIRLANYRRFSEVGKDLESLWPGSEFRIINDHTNGLVYYRQKVTANTDITLNESYLEERGIDNIEITYDHDKTYNLVRLPFYKLQRREPDFFTQAVTADTAFLKTSVTLNGQPTNVEQSVLLFDDFSDGDINPEFTDDDINNPSPYEGFTQADGYLVEGKINEVQGLHFLDTTAVSPTVKFGDIGRVTDPGETQPFDGTERQTLFCKEFVVSTAGDAILCGIMDQSTVTSTIQTGATTTSIPLASATGFVVNDRIDIGGEKTYITNISTNTLTVSPALTGAPSAGTTCEKHRLALSRVKFGIYFKANGDLKYIQDGVETAFSTPRTYTASPTTYSLRVYMRSWETTITGGISATGCTLDDGTHFQTGDVVELYTLGSRDEPELRIITKGTGDTITYTATENTPSVGYRVKTKPKIHVDIKGGSYGDINGRTWTQIHEANNTWNTTEDTDADEYGVLLALHKSIIGTITLFKVYNPPGVTALAGGTYLHLGTQEVDSSELDVDAIIRKVGTHYQLDFFPDSKTLWGSGSVLELRYDEKFRHDFEAPDLESMRVLAKARGHILTGNETASDLARLGGRTLDTIELLPNPITLTEAMTQSRAILDAVKDLAVTVRIKTDTHSDRLVKVGEVIKSELPDVSDLVVEQVQIDEYFGSRGLDDKTLVQQTITAGTVDRLSNILLQRKIKNGTRLVLDDGLQDDSFTRLQQSAYSDSASTSEAYTHETCDGGGTTTIHDQTSYTRLACLRMPT